MGSCIPRGRPSLTQGCAASPPPPPCLLPPQDYPARKKARSTKGLSLSALLPAPKNAAADSGRRLDLGAGPSKAGSGAAAYDSDDDVAVPGAEDSTGMALGPGSGSADGPLAAPPPQRPPPQRAQHGAQQQQQQQQQAAAMSNEAYRVGGPQAQYQAQYSQQYAPQYDVRPDPAYYQQRSAAAAGAAHHAALAAANDPLAAAAAAGGIQFKEVSADAVKYVAPGARAEMDALSNALGPDYEARLRAEAGPAPTKLAKRRHQIGSLFHEAKQSELRAMDAKAAAVKTKTESKRKYGW